MTNKPSLMASLEVDHCPVQLLPITEIVLFDDVVVKLVVSL
jgi:hypothetical protein